MGRRSGPRPPFSVYSDRGIAFINARVGSRRVRESLGLPLGPPDTRSARDEREAQKAAAQRYAELVAGRVLAPGPRVLTTLTLHELITLWLAEMAPLYPRSIKALIVYGRHFESFADEGADKRAPLERITADDGPQRYALHRIKSTLRGTLRKELSALGGFLAWAKANEMFASVPPRAVIPKGMHGTRTGPQRAKPVAITPREAQRIIAALPEWAAKGGRKGGDRSTIRGAFPVRDRFVFAYETGLRPSSLDRLEVPRHWVPGSRDLTITDDIDKASFGRTVPLSDAAIAVLERHAPAAGLVFGRHDYRAHVKAAALKVLPAAKARAFAAYDFRHGRGTHALEASGDLLGVAHLLGHRQVTTTNLYVHTSEEHARNVIKSVSNRSASECEGRDLNPHESYPASTSSEVVSDNQKAFSDSERHGVSENAEKMPPGDHARSASGQQASGTRRAAHGSRDGLQNTTPARGSEECRPNPLVAIRGALAVEVALWDAFDAFTEGHS